MDGCSCAALETRRPDRHSRRGSAMRRRRCRLACCAIAGRAPLDLGPFAALVPSRRDLAPFLRRIGSRRFDATL